MAKAGTASATPSTPAAPSAPVSHESPDLAWKQIGKSKKDIGGMIEETFAAKVSGGAIVRVKRTGYNPMTKAPVVSDAMVFVPDATR